MFGFEDTTFYIYKINRIEHPLFCAEGVFSYRKLHFHKLKWMRITRK